MQLIPIINSVLNLAIWSLALMVSTSSLNASQGDMDGLTEETSSAELVQKLDKATDEVRADSIAELLDRGESDMILEAYDRYDYWVYFTLMESLADQEPKDAALVWISILNHEDYWSLIKSGGKKAASHGRLMEKAQKSVGVILGDQSMQGNAFDWSDIVLGNGVGPIKKGIGYLFLDRSYRLATIERLQRMIDAPAADALTMSPDGIEVVEDNTSLEATSSSEMVQQLVKARVQDLADSIAEFLDRVAYDLIIEATSRTGYTICSVWFERLADRADRAGRLEAIEALQRVVEENADVVEPKNIPYLLDKDEFSVIYTNDDDLFLKLVEFLYSDYRGFDDNYHYLLVRNPKGHLYWNAVIMIDFESVDLGRIYTSSQLHWEVSRSARRKFESGEPASIPAYVNQGDYRRCFLLSPILPLSMNYFAQESKFSETNERWGSYLKTERDKAKQYTILRTEEAFE